MRIVAKSVAPAMVAGYIVIPAYQLYDHMKADMLKDRTAAYVVPASTSATSSFAMSGVPDMILGGYFDASPVVPGGVTYILGPKIPGATST